MRLTVAIMVKNEIDVIRDCCSHLLSLFDDIVIVDHRSTDGTREYLAELEKLNSRFHVYHLTEPGYYQSQLMTWLVNNVNSCVAADWLFLLDADEVLPFSSRIEFEHELERYKSSPIIKMPWKNLIPAEYSSKGVMGRDYYETEASNIFNKIAYQPQLLPVNNYIIAQGNHAILACDNGGEIHSQSAFNVYHIPVRTKVQFGFKIHQGTAAYSIMSEARNKTLGAHWFDISEYIEKYGMTDEFLNGLAYGYGQTIDVNNVKIAKEDLLKLGCSRIRLDYAWEDLPEISKKIESADKISKMLADLKVASSCAIRSEDVLFKLCVNKEIICMGNKNKQFYNALPKKINKHSAENDLEFMIGFLSPAAEKIESTTPTAWGGHIPFLFCLVACLKPRIYTELGSHYGASYFAACQAMQKNKLNGQAVAIDLWQGDEHAGFYGESVFDSFINVFNGKYSDVGDYLRMSFDEASELFENQSIDILHIDGLHTYEAVKHDYETWRSRLTDNGVIIFHDTNVFERGFGVWKLWEEISSDAVSFEFKHTHGLGVLAFGSLDENPIARLLKMINNSETLSGYFEEFYSRLGELTFNEAVLNESKKSPEMPPIEVPVQLHRCRGVVKNNIVRFVKSVPILKSMARSILRVARR